MMPATTIAKAPETCKILLANMKPAVGIVNVIRISKEPSSVLEIRICAIKPSTNPNKIPPIASCKNKLEMPENVASCPPKATAKTVTKITKPTPSLKSDSPSTCIDNRFGARKFLIIANTAIGSVGEIKAPKTTQ